MTYLLDTNVVSAMMREEAGVASWLSNVGDEDQLLICTVVRGEILFGLQRMAGGRRRSDLEAKAQKLLAALPCESISPTVADAYAVLKVARQRRGLSLDENDLWIAATALSCGATLVTRDSDFHRLGELEVIVP